MSEKGNSEKKLQDEVSEAEEIAASLAESPAKTASDNETASDNQDAGHLMRVIEQQKRKGEGASSDDSASVARMAGYDRLFSRIERRRPSPARDVEPDARTTDPAVSVSVADEDPAEVTDLPQMILRRRWLIAFIVAVSLIAGAVMLSNVTPRYSATAEIIIESNAPTIAALEALVPGLGIDEQSIISETEVLQSRILLTAVAQTLDLMNDPEFNKSLRPPDLQTRLLASVGLASSEPAPSGQPLPRVLNSLLSGLDVSHVPDSRVISVRFESESPDRAAEIPNTLLDEYLLAQQRAKVEASEEAGSILDERIAELRAQVAESEQQLERYRSEANLLQAGGTTLISQQLRDLSTQLIDARGATAAASARLTQVAGIIDLTTGVTGDSSLQASSMDVLQSPLIQNLRQQQVTIERRIAESSSQFGPAHPTMIQLAAEAQDLELQIAEEIDKIAQALRNEVAVARAREDDLERQVSALELRLAETNEAEVELRSRERDAAAARGLLEDLLSQQAQLGPEDRPQDYRPDARVISYADLPLSPSYPNKPLAMGAIFVAAVLVAFGVVLMLELWRRGFLSLDQLERTSKLTALGFLPYVRSKSQRREFVNAVIKDRSQPYSQAITAISWQIEQLAPSGTRFVHVVSSAAGEGKTSFAISLARSRAVNGEKALLIDADLRDPTVSNRLGLPDGPGLRDVLEGTCSAVDAIVKDDDSPLDILPAGKATFDTLPLLRSEAIERLLKQLGARYQIVIFDGPPVVAGPDACVLSKLVDTSIMLVRFAKTPGPMLNSSLRTLRRNGGHILGTVLTMVDASRSSRSAYGIYGAYGEYGAHKN